MKACPMVDFFEQKITKGTKERQATDGRGMKRGTGTERSEIDWSAATAA
jgi:hypothetical protein